MNFEAVPCVIKNAAGVPTYGLLIRPLQRLDLARSVDGDRPESIEVGEKAPDIGSGGHMTPIDLSSQPPSSDSYAPDDHRTKFNPVFIPASNLATFQQNKFDPAMIFDRANYRRSDVHMQTSIKFPSCNSQQFACPAVGPKSCVGGGLQHLNHLHEPGANSAGDFENFFEDFEMSSLLFQDLSYDGQELVQLDSASLNASQLEIMDTMPSASFAERLIQHSAASISTSTSSRFSCRYQHSPSPDPCISVNAEPYTTTGSSHLHDQLTLAIAPTSCVVSVGTEPSDSVVYPLPTPQNLQAVRPSVVALYPAAATPDSGIQSIGESPRSPLFHHSPAQPSTSRSGPTTHQSPHMPLTQPLSICTKMSGTDSTDDSPLEPGLLAPKPHDYGDMPQLERQVEFTVAHGPLTSLRDTKTRLIDQLLSSLPADQLELLRMKLQAVEVPVSAATPSTEDDGRNSESKSEMADLTAKKLAEYRAKMRQKRQSQQLAREIDSICHRLHQLSENVDSLSSQCELKMKFLHPVNWTLVERRCNKHQSNQTDEGSTACLNLEREASDDDAESGETCEGVDPIRFDSLKVKIKLLSHQSELLTSDRPPALHQTTPEMDRPLTLANLPLKKRFKCQSTPKLSVKESQPSVRLRVGRTPLVVGRNPVASMGGHSFCMDKLHSKRARFSSGVEHPSSRCRPALSATPPRLCAQRRAIASDDRCLSRPLPTLSPQGQILDCQLPQPVPFSSVACENLSARAKINPGILRRCSDCGCWLKAARTSQTSLGWFKCTKCLIETKRTSPTKLRLPHSPFYTCRLLSPKKKFVKCGSRFLDEKQVLCNSVFVWPDCPMPIEIFFFELPYDLWWHDVYQKKFVCKEPSTNYRRIRNNIYVDAKLAAAAPCQPCNCTAWRPMESQEICDENCLNRIMLTECSNGICPCGDLCSNRRFQKRRWATDLEKFWTGPGKGFGVRTTKIIKAGTFVCEYLGELVNPETFAERMRTWYRSCTRHFALTVDCGTVIDGYRCGSVARFINHSCRPNCNVQKWLVNGQFRVGIFATFDIEPGQELTYDYNFRSFVDANVEKCLCLSPNCTGNVGITKCNRSAFCRSGATTNSSSFSPFALSRIARRQNLWLPRNFHLTQRNKPTFNANQAHVKEDAIDLNLSRLCCKLNPMLQEKPALLLAHTDVKKLVKLTLSCASTSSAEYRAAYALTRLLAVLVADPSAADDDAPLVGSYDPDDLGDSPLWRFSIKAIDVPPLNVDKVRCVCGFFDEEGTMVQCDCCLYWLHANCLPLQRTGLPDDSTPFHCEFCFLGDSQPLRQGLRDVCLVPQPDFRLSGCLYYRALMKGSLQIRLGDCIYLKRNVDHRHRWLLATLNEQTVRGGVPQDGSANWASLEHLIDDHQRHFRRDQLRIMRVERLFINAGGVQFAFGNYFARHYETFCEPSRRFYENEVFVTPLYDTWPLDAVMGRCLVLDPATFCTGRPSQCSFDSRDVYICEYRVDKAQRLFDKSTAAKFRHSLNTNSYYFTKFNEKLKITRNYTELYKKASLEKLLTRLNSFSVV